MIMTFTYGSSIEASDPASGRSWGLRTAPEVLQLENQLLASPSAAMSLSTVVLTFFAVMEAGELPVRIVAVVSSRGDVRGGEGARDAGLPCGVFRRRDYPDVAAHNAAINAWLAAYSPGMIALAELLGRDPMPLEDEVAAEPVAPKIMAWTSSPIVEGSGLGNSTAGSAVTPLARELCASRPAVSQRRSMPSELTHSGPVSA